MTTQSITNYLTYVIKRTISETERLHSNIPLKDYTQEELDLTFPTSLQHTSVNEPFTIDGIGNIDYLSRLVKECAEEIIFYINGATSVIPLFEQNRDHPLIRHSTSPDALVEYLSAMEEAGIIDADSVPGIIASVPAESFGDIGPSIGSHWRRWTMIQPQSEDQQTIHPFALQEEDINTIDARTLAYLNESWECLGPQGQAQFKTRENYLKLYLASETDQLGKVIQAIEKAVKNTTTKLDYKTVICDNPTYRKISKLAPSHQPFTKRASLEPLAKVLTFTVRERTKKPSLTTISYDYQTNLNVTLSSPKGLDELFRTEIMYMMLLSIIAAATKTMPGKLTFFIDEFIVADEDIRRESQDDSFKTKTTITFNMFPPIKTINDLEFTYVNSILNAIKLEV